MIGDRKVDPSFHYFTVIVDDVTAGLTVASLLAEHSSVTLTEDKARTREKWAKARRGQH